MKHSLCLLFLLAIATPLTPLFASDEGGDGAYIPSYQELVREGYGPRFTPVLAPVKNAPKPTQAYYGNGYTIYYGYTVVPVRVGYDNANLDYAFGYPIEYFRQMMPTSITETNLNRYAVEMSTPYYDTNGYGPGTYVAKAPADHSNAVTTVQSTARTTTTTTPSTPSNGANPLPAIGEKPSH